MPAHSIISLFNQNNIIKKTNMDLQNLHSQMVLLQIMNAYNKFLLNLNKKEVT